MRLRSVIVFLFAAGVCRISLPAAEPLVICGTERGGAKEELFLHRQSLATRQKLGLRTATGPVGKDAGDVAILYDSNGVVARRNPFNLSSKGITFTPAPGFTRYRFATGGANYDASAAAAGTVLFRLNDDDTRRIDIPFAFPFFGARFNSLFVNSDGNVTFGQGDPNAATKTVGLLAGGPPRIGVLFADLDPTRSSKGVKVFSDAARVVITWEEVPEFGAGRPATTFQLRLHSDGRIEFSYPNVSVREAVVGIAPGNAEGSAELVSFQTTNSTEYNAAVAERFTNTDAIDTVLLAQRFFQTHEDAYDYLAVYNTLGIPARSFTVATELTVRSTNRSGFGDTVVDIGAQYGSPTRLQAMLNMGPLSNYSRDPNGTVPLRSSTGDTPLTILSHETGHLFLALASVRDEVDPAARPMLGGALAHWSFNFNSEASFLEGNRIADRGENTSPRFSTVATVQAYSPLDQYLMGFRPPEEVPPTFLVRNTGRANDDLPQVGVFFNGVRRNVTIEDVIAAEGRRSPDHTVAQRRFRMAVILVIKEGTEPAPEDLTQIDQLRREFEGFFQRAASNRASIDTSLKKNLALSVWPAAGMVQGSTLDAAVTLDQPAVADVPVMLRTQTGAASMPGSVVIPAGAKQASFRITALRSGVEEITAEPGDSRYRGDFAKVQVAALSGVSLELVSGDKQLAAPGAALPDDVVVRAADINLIPYPGLSIRATTGTGGTVTPATAVTGPDGTARFRWTTGNGPIFEMRAALAGSSAAVTATALHKPAFQATGVLNAASYTPGITPGGLAAVFGAGLAAGATQEAPSLPWPTSLAGVQVMINGEPCPLYYAADGQINFLVPLELRGSSAQLVVSTPWGDSDAVPVPVLPLSPGLFYNVVTGEAAVRVAGTGLLTSERPAAAGEYLEIYGTGLGALQPSTIPSLLETVTKPVVSLNGIPAEVLFSGLTPGIPGLYQINIRIPDGLPQGLVKLRITADGAPSNEADVTLR